MTITKSHNVLPTSSKTLGKHHVLIVKVDLLQLSLVVSIGVISSYSDPCIVPHLLHGRLDKVTLNRGLDKMNIEQRRHARQLRRIESLCAQVKSYVRDPQPHKEFKCQELWESIREATGFHKGFPTWVGQTLQWFVPLACPPSEYLEELKEHFRHWHTKNLQKYFQERKRARRLSIALDIAKGGSNTFREVRETPALPLSYVVQTIEAQVCPMRWPKSGLRHLKLKSNVNFDLQQPILFQGQTCIRR